MSFDPGLWHSGLGWFGVILRDFLKVSNGTFSVLWVVEPDLTLVCMLWLGGRFAPGASSSRQSGSHCWGKRIIGFVPLTLIQQHGAAFGLVPSDWYRWCVIVMHTVLYLCCALLITLFWAVIITEITVLIMISVLGGWASTTGYVMIMLCCYWLWLVNRLGVVTALAFWCQSSFGLVPFGLVPLRYLIWYECILLYDMISLTGR